MFVGSFEPALHSFYTVLSFTRYGTKPCSAMCVDAYVAGTRVGWVNPDCRAYSGVLNHCIRPTARTPAHTSASVLCCRERHRFFAARDLRGDADFFDFFDGARTRSGSFLPPVSRFHSSKASFAMFPSTSN